MKTTKIVEVLSVLSALGSALARSAAALIEAEVEQLRFDVAQNWGRLLRLVLLAGLVFGVAFWALGALLFAAGAGLTSVLPVWAAALVVGGVLVALALILLWIARAQARRLESPTATVKRRVGSHLAFWRELLDEAIERSGASESETDDSSRGGS